VFVLRLGDGAIGCASAVSNVRSGGNGRGAKWRWAGRRAVVVAVTSAIFSRYKEREHVSIGVAARVGR